MNQTEKQTKKILVVEDDQKVAMGLAIRLKHSGYEVTLASDALSGLESAMKTRPDLVLLDISLPGGNGFTVAERIRALLPITTPTIFLTASKQPGLREKARDLGAAAFFQKPYESEDLLAAIQLALAGPAKEEEHRVYVL